MWLIGVPYQDVMLVGSLLGQKTILNEFVAYFQLQEWKDAGLFLYQKSILMSTYILCGFANISSIGILLGGMGVLAPERGTDHSFRLSGYDCRCVGIGTFGYDNRNDVNCQLTMGKSFNF